MKRLVLVGEGHGEVPALPILVAKLLEEADPDQAFYPDREVIRGDRANNRPDFSRWIARVTLAARRREAGGVLAIYDGDAPHFPPGSGTPFCAGTAGKAMAAAARAARAGETFSLAVVFACTEYETWLIAGIESLSGRTFEDGRSGVPRGVEFPRGDPEAHGKKWLERVFPGYRPALHQSELTRMLDLNVVRAKRLRSFQRLEHALEQLLRANRSGAHVSTP